jgi:hypothetical protein
MNMPPFIPDTRLTPQPPPVSPGFSSKGMEPIPGSLAYSIKRRRYTGNHLGEHTPQLSRVSKQDYSELQREHDNELLRNRVKNHLYQPLPNAAPSPAPQSKFHHMFREAKKYAWPWGQRPQQHQQQQQQPPHTRGRSSPEIQRTNALFTLGLPPNSNPTRADVKKAFNTAALGNHPDKVADRTEKFIEVYKAYKFLMDNLGNQNGGNVAKTGGNNTIKRRHKKHKYAKKTRGKTHSNRRSKTRGKTYRKTRKNTTKRR